MPDEIEMQKRANYHDLGRDDWMSLDEYLLSGLSDKDLGLAEGGIVSLLGFNSGGSATREGLLNRIKEVKNLKTITKELGTGTQTIGAGEIKKPIIKKTTPEGVKEGAVRPSTAVEVKTAKRDYGKEKTFEVKKQTKIAETVTKARAPVFTGSSADYFKKLETYAGKNPNVLTSSGFLANFGEFRKSISDAAKAGDKNILKKFFILDPKEKGSLKLPNGKVYKFNQKVLNAAFENAFPEYKKVGQEAPLIRNIKKYFKKQGGKITKQGGVMLQMALNEAQRLSRTGNFKAARRLLSGIVKIVPNLARFSAWLGPLTGIGYATDVLGLTDIMGFKTKKTEPSENEMPQTQRFNRGGVMDIDYMTRPLNYRDGGEAETIPSRHQFSSDDINTIKNMLKSEMLRQNSPDINTDKIAYQFMAEMGYKPTEENLKGVQDAITMGIFDAQNELDRENTSDLGRLVGTAQDKYQTFKESEDKMGLIRNKIEEGLGALWQ